MNREEAIKTLSILKAAYPNSFKNLTKEEANGIINIWSMQFYKTPYTVVMLAINKLIGANAFPPTISEVKQSIQSLHYEALEMLQSHKQATEGTVIADGCTAYLGKKLDDKTLKVVNLIIKATEELEKPTLSDLLTSENPYLLGVRNDDNN